MSSCKSLLARLFVYVVMTALVGGTAAVKASQTGVLSPASHCQHDTDDERYNIYGQLTYISNLKLPFSAAYTNLGGSNYSLLPAAEHSYTGSLTLYLALSLWSNAELYCVPELMAQVPLSRLHGLGSAIQNFELQKMGPPYPVIYLSRLYLQQTFNLGGEQVQRDSAPMQLGKSVDATRFVVTAGNFSALDIFDKNTFAADLRKQWLNMAFLSHAAYDFAADARGYTWGVSVEYFYKSWAARVARLAPPQYPNQLELNFKFWEVYGDQLEVQHAHAIADKPGVVRLLMFRNREYMGRFAAATAAYRMDPTRNASTCPNLSAGFNNARAPDLCHVRQSNVKLGIGLNLEQNLGAGMGVFFRGMVTDGASEVDSYTSTDHSLSAGILGSGALWRRPADILGLGYGQGFISHAHAAYLNAGGIDAFIGDGKIRHASERVLEAFYAVDIFDVTQLSVDYQWIVNPAYNADRGPVSIFGIRLHVDV